LINLHKLIAARLRQGLNQPAILLDPLIFRAGFYELQETIFSNFNPCFPVLARRPTQTPEY
jgi:hypothetical protein